MTRRVSRAMTVEVHDVTPACAREIATICDALASVGVDRPTLLVVPAFVDPRGQRWRLGDDRGMVAWLRRMQRAGCDIVQHGLTHRAEQAPPAGLRNAFMHHVFSRGCAEFAHLDGDEARRRLRVGRAMLETLGLRPGGFIAPAWQQSAAALEQVRREGFDFTAFLGHVLPLRGARAGQIVSTPALTFDAPNAVVDHGKRAVMRALERVARRRELLRVALHPQDVRGSRPLEHIVSRVRALLAGGRQLVSYAQWLDASPDELVSELAYRETVTNGALARREAA